MGERSGRVITHPEGARRRRGLRKRSEANARRAGDTRSRGEAFLVPRQGQRPVAEWRLRAKPCTGSARHCCIRAHAGTRPSGGGESRRLCFTREGSLPDGRDNQPLRLARSRQRQSPARWREARAGAPGLAAEEKSCGLEGPRRQRLLGSVSGRKQVRIEDERNARSEIEGSERLLAYETEEVNPLTHLYSSPNVCVRVKRTGDQLIFPVAAALLRYVLPAESDVSDVGLVTAMKECPKIYEKHLKAPIGFSKLARSPITFALLADALDYLQRFALLGLLRVFRIRRKAK